MMNSLRSAVCLLALAGICGAARAETSSWQQKIVPTTATKPPPAGSRTKVQSRPVEPGQAPKQKLGAAGSGAAAAADPGRSLGPATTAGLAADGQAASSDPAYEAFDQGRYLTALSLAARLVASGDPQAHTLIGRIHADGLGVPQDANLAAMWYARALELGDLEAALALGTLHARGNGVPQDFNKAADLFEQAAARGHPEANYNLALLFLAGSGKAENPRRGFQLMQYAAEKGVTAAMYDLGTLHATGTGTAPNAFEAATWIGRAANAGHAEAEVDYAVILLKDHTLPDDQKAKLRRRGVELLRSAAAKGLAIAQNRLAYCHLQGIGTPKDPAEAAKWHLVAKAGGQEDPALDKVVANLSRTERQKAVATAAEWREQTFLE